jgi:bifunctional non-homologous end joining protein LigD
VLEKYREKRDFERTPEPPPGPAPGEGPLIFVIQKHAATRLHYDFRLEVDGVLKSWPIPKGPSLNPADKRLAVMVEDHPFDYASFEGVIPKGEYGGGQVIVWDAGDYSPDEDGRLSFHDREEAQARMREGIAKGKISVFLRGQKLKGSWTLVKTKRSENEWLFIKHRDRFADTERDIVDEDRSVLSGLTIEDLKAGRLPERGTVAEMGLRPGDLPGARPASFPGFVEPMHASLAESAFSSPKWLFEPKLDGVRGIAPKDGERVRLFSRRGIEATKSYPRIVSELSEQPEPRMVVDGEIVAFDEKGVPSFQQLQQRLNLMREADIKRAEAQVPVFYYAFDLLWCGEYDLRGAPLAHRKRLLRQILTPSERVQLVEPFEEDGEIAFAAAVEHGLEGVLAKKADSPYESGRRSKNWLKIKGTQEAEFVIAGYTEGGGWRAGTFGSLLLGYYDDDGRLVYAGHVGTGFDDRTLRTLKERLEPLKTDKMPFVEQPKRGGLVFGRPKNAQITWVKPELVAQVKFLQWTSDGVLRAPSFLGLREDKAPAEVRKEEPLPSPGQSRPAGTPAPDTNAEVARVLEQLGRPEEKFILSVEGHKISVSNLDKELWPPFEDRRGLTKRDLLTYFAKISPYLVPHMRDRPLTLTRYPNGIYGGHFYQKRFENKVPEFVETVRLYSQDNGHDVDYMICNNLPTLLWLGQLADIELHTWYSRISPEPDGHHLPRTFAGSVENIDASLLNYPDFMVFDLDPYIYSGKEKKGAEPELNRQAYLKTCEVALWLKDLLDSLSLSSFVKTTGKTGLHVYVPVLRQHDYDEVRAMCQTLGRILMQQHPKDITMEWMTEKRTGKVFFDHNQNSRGKTLASLYSPRPSPQAAVSMPVRWEEIKDVYPADFTILNAYDRVAETGDLWEGILDAKHDLAALLGAIGEEALSS